MHCYSVGNLLGKEALHTLLSPYVVDCIVLNMLFFSEIRYPTSPAVLVVFLWEKSLLCAYTSSYDVG